MLIPARPTAALRRPRAMLLLRTLARPIRLSDDPAVLLEDIAARLTRTLKPKGYLIWLLDRPAESGRRIVSWLGAQPPAGLLCFEGDIRLLSVEANGYLHTAFVKAGMRLVAPLLGQSEPVGWLGVGAPPRGHVYSPAARYYLVTLAGQVGAALHNRRLRARLNRSEEQLRPAYRRIVQAREEERRQLAGVLHDETLQQLADISVRLGLLRSRPDLNPAELDDLQRRLARTDRDLREIVRGVHPAILSDLGLVEAVIAFLETLARRHRGPPAQIRLTLRGFGPARLPDEGLELNLYRVMQNAVTNAVKHGRPGRIALDLSWGTAFVELRVQDDGCGLQTTIATAVRDGHLGLLTMRERVEALGGSFKLWSEPGRGTRVIVRVPLARPTATPQLTERYTIELGESVEANAR